MRRFLLSAIFTALSLCSKSQNLSFTCPRDTIVGCNTACFSLKARFPDIRAIGSDYTVSNVSASASCLPYVDARDSGVSTNLSIDDTYSNIITLPFSFPFYGISYTSLVASTNGYLSFDVGLATGDSHYEILNNNGFLSSTNGVPENLPSALYDAALIMGPYHDLNPAITTSPTRQIKYNEVGTAPNRRWVLSFYKEPLFSCNTLIENTHQIILYESTGIIEVKVIDKQVCSTWNQGRALIGLQNFDKTKGVMAPGRRASDPPWDMIGTNEVWRFIPTGGAPLYRSVQLLDGTGTVVATGDTTRINVNTFEVSFPVVCPPAGNSIFVVKTTYQKINDASTTIFSLDTIRVSRQVQLPITATTTATTCGSNTGTITVTTAGGVPPYQYSVDGGVLQSSNIFIGLGSGSHTIFAQDAAGCNNTITVTVSSLASVPGNIISNTGTSCPGLNNGSLTVVPTAGQAPFTFSIDGGPGQASGTFTGLSAGSHTIVFTDANGCNGTLTAITSAGAAIAASLTTVSASCPGANNGSVSITPTSGTGPYSFSLDGGPFQPGTIPYVVGPLAPGNHSVAIRDANNCTGVRTFFIGSGIAITSTFTSTQTSCPGVNNGSITIIPTNGIAPYTYSLDGGPFQSGNILTGLAFGTHVVTIRDASGCTGTKTVIITSGTDIAFFFSTINSSCQAGGNGIITVIPVIGTAPYTYSLNGGTPQSSPVLTGALAGYNTVVMTDANGCSATMQVWIMGGSVAVSGTATSSPATCPGATNGTITVTASGGSAPYTYSLNGGTAQTFNLITGVVTGQHVVRITDAGGCTVNINITVGAGPGITGTITTTSASCPGASNGSATVIQVNGVAPFTYSIDGLPMQTSPVFLNLTPGVHLISFVDAGGCTGTATVTIAQGLALTATASAVNTSCAGVNNGSVTAVPVSGSGPYQFSINGGASYQATATFSGLAPGSYTITVKDNAGCTGTVSATVAAGTNIVSSVTTINPPCANTSTGSITISPITGSTPFQFGLNGGSAQAGNVFSNLAPGNYTIAITDAVGCTGTNTAILTTNNPLATQLSIKMPLCNDSNNGSITLTSSGGVAPYQYSKDGGTTYQPSTILNGLAAGTYTIRIKDNVGCTKDTTAIVNQPSALNAAASSAVASCAGNDGVINITATGGTTPYQYSINGTTFVSPNNITTPAVGTYTITVKDANGCLATTTNTVVLVDNMTFDAGADTTVCAEQSITLQPQTNPQTNIFNWTPATAISSTTIRNPSVSPLMTITYYVTATWGTCTRTDSLKVTVKNKPLANAGPDVTICNNDSSMLKGSASNLSGTVSYQWSPSATVLKDTDSATVAFPDLTQIYTLTVTDNYGCNYSVKDDVKVIVRPPVPADAGRDSIAILGMPYQLTATGGSQFSWSPSSILNNPSSSTPLATLSMDTRFTVTVTDVAGCVGTDTVFVKAYNGPTYYTPNAFSPNGDGLNDIFRAIPVGIVSTEYFRIFNRYGELIFETNQWLKGWDGTYMSRKQQIGVYVWIIKGRNVAGKVVERKGTVLLVQ